MFPHAALRLSHVRSAVRTWADRLKSRMSWIFRPFRQAADRGVPREETRRPQLHDYTPESLVMRNDRGAVHRAVERGSQRVVALKTIRIGNGSPADRALWRERFLREAESSSRLRHPGIVQVEAGGVHGQGDGLTGWLAMEWIEGGDLSPHTTPAHLLPGPVALDIVGRVALALHHAHRQGIVHRDVKPSNILFDAARNLVKVTDFGSARVADSEATRSGLIVGTPAYMAPEQLAGVDATPQSDLYSLGIVLFELLCGRRPFDADSMGGLLRRIAHEPVPRLSGLRPDLPGLVDDILQRLLSKNAADRHPDGQRLAIELRLAQARSRATAPLPARVRQSRAQSTHDPSARRTPSS